MKKRPLKNFIPFGKIAPPQRFKLHAARTNRSGERALDLYVNNRKGWEDMHRWRSGNNDFNRDYLFSIIRFDPEEDMWLFGGIYKVIGRGRKESHSYKVRKLPEYSRYEWEVKNQVAYARQNQSPQTGKPSWQNVRFKGFFKTLFRVRHPQGHESINRGIARRRQSPQCP